MTAILKVGYTNHRGEYSVRSIVPVKVWWGKTEWHPESQWLLQGIDTDKGELRDFALKDFGFSEKDYAAAVELAEEYEKAQCVANEHGFGPGTAAEAIAYFAAEAAAPRLRPIIELLAGPRTHICWTPDAVPTELREEVVLVRRRDLEAIARMRPAINKGGRELEEVQPDIFTEVAKVYAAQDARKAKATGVATGLDPKDGTWADIKDRQLPDALDLDGDQGYPDGVVPLEAVPEWAFWDKEIEDFVNRSTGNSAGVPFKLKWYSRREEFPDYLEYCRSRRQSLADPQ